MPLIDLSAPIAPDPPEFPDQLRTDITYESHAAGARAIQTLFGVGPELLRNEEGWAVETFTNFGTHSTTHVDAPWHYNSTIGGEPAQTIDQLPLEWFFAPGVVIDATDRSDGEALSAADLEERLPRPLAERDIVLIHTGRDAYYGQADYIIRGPGVTAEATRWLCDRGIRVMGIDAWGWDSPLHLQAQQAIETGDQGVFWAAHQIDLAYAQIERLVNLAALPSHGFTVCCFPLRLVGGSGAPSRVVAIVGEDEPR